jgi:YfiH family protein
MPFHQPDSIRYYLFASLGETGVSHAIFTRRGGVSSPPWQSLNLGGTVGDHPDHVAENRRRAFRSLNRPLSSNFDVWQVHSATVIRADAPRSPDKPHLQADAIITDKPGVTLFMRFADCVPILLVDPVRRAIGIVHAGWLGTVRQVVGAAVTAMRAEFGSSPGDLLAGIGPSIAAHHYPVGPDVIEQVQSVYGSDAGSLLPESDGSTHFDLWAANKLVLESHGVRQIEIAGICTACEQENWYSHRGEHGKTGRFGALIGL